LQLSFDGDTCVLAGTKVLEAASAIPEFKGVEVLEGDKRRDTLITAPALHGLVLSFDASAMLGDIRREQMARGHLKDPKQTLQYRFFFCAPNGYSLLKPNGAMPEELARSTQESFGLTSRTPPHAAFSRCIISSGRLRAMGFGPLVLRLVEKKIRVSAAMLGNRDSWVGAVVEVAVQGAKKSAAVQITLTGQEPTFQAAVDCPKGDDAQVSLKVLSAPDFDPAAPATAQGKIDLRPQFLPDAKTKGPTIDRIGDHFVIWCDSQGIEAPLAGTVELPFAKGDKTRLGQLAPAQKRAGKVPELVLKVTEKGGTAGLDAKDIEYYVPIAKGGGCVTRDGIFAARFLRSKLDAHKAYTVKIEQRTAGKRKSTIASVAGEIPAQAPLNTGWR
jgi:hypothetical protein